MYTCPLPSKTITYSNFNANEAKTIKHSGSNVEKNPFVTPPRQVAANFYNPKGEFVNERGITRQRLVGNRTGFTPILEATEKFAKLESTSSAERLKAMTPKTKIGTVLYAYSEEHARFLENYPLPEGCRYEIQVVRRFDSVMQRSGLRATIQAGSTKGRGVGRFASHSKTGASPNIFLCIKRGLALTSFELFVNLPAELQIEVWKHSLPGPRTVRIHVSESLDEFKPQFSRSVPAILQVSHVARTLALKTLYQAFPTTTKRDTYIYFNLAIDTLRLSLRSAQRMAMVTTPVAHYDREHIRHVEIVFPMLWSRTMWAAMAELVLASPHRSWPLIQSWCFPGKRADGKPKATRKELLFLTIKRTNKATAELPETVNAVAKSIGEKTEAGRLEFGIETQIGIMITYDGPPLDLAEAVVGGETSSGDGVATAAATS
jgi:hypothetical protein